MLLCWYRHDYVHRHRHRHRREIYRRENRGSTGASCREFADPRSETDDGAD